MLNVRHAPRRLVWLALLFAPACAGSNLTNNLAPSSEGLAEAPLVYPDARRVDTVDDYHGTEVADPYRWMEDPDSAETQAWVRAQNVISQAWLAAVPEREAIRERLSSLWNYERYGTPWKRGSRYFFSKNDGLQNQSVMYVAESLDAEPRVLIDPNTFSEDGTVSLSGMSISEDGRYLAYALADGGSDWTTWYVRDIDTGKDLDDKLEWVKFSGAAWSHDNRGFFYSRYPEPTTKLEGVNRDQKVYYHTLGTPQSQDALIYERPDQPEWGFGSSVTEDGELVVLSVWHGTARKNRIYYRPVAGAEASFVQLLDDFDAGYNLIGKQGNWLFFRTDLDAPRHRVIAIDLNAPAREHWREIVPEASETLQQASMVGGRLVCRYLEDARTSVRMYETDGTSAGTIRLPGLGTASGFGGRADDPETFFTFSDYTQPTAIYRYDVRTGESSLHRAPKVDFASNDYVTRQVFYTSKDGTRIPMFLTHKRNIRRDGERPTLLYGYGGFDISLTPGFNVARAVWLEMGGVYAVANLRGGGEYGREWHEAGTKERKQNVFDDFIAAAEWLVENDYTAPERLGIMGRSNGGLLVGACITQRPDLFGAALPGVGVLDMLRYHKFTIGWAWASDYGTSDTPEEFASLIEYSPVHNVTPGTAYPPTLVTTGDHDDRVVPMHSFKFTAALQNAQAGSNPILARIETRAGHGAGKPTAMRIDEATDELAFLVRALGMRLDGFAPRAK